MNKFLPIIGLLIQHSLANALSVSIVGSEERVFDYTTDRCEQYDIPDASPRMVNTREGVKLFHSSYTTYASLTDDFQNFRRDCNNPVYESGYNDNFFAYRDREWPTSFIVSDKNPNLIYSIIHGEYHGHLRFNSCQNDYVGCWQNYLTGALSDDGLKTIKEDSVSLIASTTLRYRPNRGPMGVFHPSNIQRRRDASGRTFYYFLGHVEARKNIASIPLAPSEQQTGVCVFRSTEDQGRGLPTGDWLAWDGRGYNADLTSGDICAVVSKPQIFKMTRSLVRLDKDVFLLVGTVGGPSAGTYYSVSRDLINWSARQLLFSHRQPGNGVAYAFPSVISHDSKSLSFSDIKKSDENIYLYMTKFNSGWSLDRDLVRYKIEVDY